jgi:prepilin-type N-terminal cleavage/methylation domain-containing protein
MRLTPAKSHNARGFTLAEVLIAVAIAVVFGAAAFAANQNLLQSLRSHRETTAASLMLQERMESFRSIGYSAVSNFVASGSTDRTQWTAGDIAANATASEAELGGITGSLQETITVSGYQNTSGNFPGSPNQNQWVRNSSHTAGSLATPNYATLAANYDLLKVDIQISWVGTGGRTRQREIAAIFGKGNLSN